MSKQSDVREHAIEAVMLHKGFDRAPTEYIVDYVLQSLNADGVGIKVSIPVVLKIGGSLLVTWEPLVGEG